jgi:hypothetical protein
MSFNVENDALADAVLSRIDADARITKAQAAIMKGKAVLLRSAGLALVLAGAGAGVGLACVGYSRVVAKQVIAQHEARDAFLAALSHATINVKVADGGEVALKKGGTVSVDRDSVVRVTGTVSADIPRPSQAAPVPTEYVVFHEVPFGEDRVETGAMFEDGQLTRQYCHYVQPAHAPIRTVTDIGQDGRMELPVSAPAGVDLRAAYEAGCMWRKDSATPERRAAK